jgi:hypothetical protein
MAVTFDQLVKHLEQPGKWQGFGALSFDVRLLTVAEALGCPSVWSNGKVPIRDFVRDALTTGTLPDLSRIMSYAGAFRDGPVILVGFTLDTLAHVWPAAYGGRAGSDLVIFDGNHRTAALAIREQLGMKDDHPVIVFVGA